MVEFAINLPPDLQYDPVHGKIFLRRANLEYLPEQILWKPKDNYFDPMRYAGIAQGHQALELLEQLKQMPLLKNIINVSCVEEILLSYRSGYAQRPKGSYRNTDANQLYDLLAFVSWYKRVSTNILEKTTSFSD